MPDTHQQNLEKATATVSVTAYLDYKEYLLAIYTFLKEASDRYSYLRFAVDLGFPKSNVLHLVVTGKRPLTSKAAVRIIKSLGLTGTERRYLDTLVKYNNSRQPTEREALFQELLELKNRTLKSSLEKSQLEFFSEWFHPIIREMMLIKDFNSDPAWIVTFLKPRVRPEQARRSLELLERLGLIKFDEETQRHVPTSNQVTTGDEVSSMAVVRYHQKVIELAKESITSVDENERDISAITVPISGETAVLMKREIQAFRKRMLALADESGGQDRVLSTQLPILPSDRIQGKGLTMRALLITKSSPILLLGLLLSCGTEIGNPKRPSGSSSQDSGTSTIYVISDIAVASDMIAAQTDEVIASIATESDSSSLTLGLTSSARQALALSLTGATGAKVSNLATSPSTEGTNSPGVVNSACKLPGNGSAVVSVSANGEDNHSIDHSTGGPMTSDATLLDNSTFTWTTTSGQLACNPGNTDVQVDWSKIPAKTNLVDNDTDPALLLSEAVSETMQQSSVTRHGSQRSYDPADRVHPDRNQVGKLAPQYGE